MKTLKEQVQEIVASSASKSSKAQQLKKLSITNYEIELLLSAPVTASPTTPRRYIFTFGVEIECGVSRESFVSAAAQTGMAYEYQGYNHRDGHTFFKFVTDGSLNVPHAIECVSPVLKGKQGLAALENACGTLNLAGADVNRSCGLHVHIGARGITEQQYANTFVNYMHLERLVDTFMARSRRANNNYYAATLQDHRDELQSCNTMRSVRNTLRGDRYHKVNPMSWERHHTIEFRQHQGTTNYNKIMNWVQFCGKLVVWSKTNRLTEDITDIDNVPFLTATEKAFFKASAERLARD